MEKTYQQGLQHKIDEEFYKTFFELEKDFRTMEKFFIEQDPQGPNKEILLMKFLTEK